MKWLTPRSLAGQLIALTLAVLIISQIALVFIMLEERQQTIRSAWVASTLGRMASAYELIVATPPNLHEKILNTAGTWVTDLNFGDAPTTTARSREGRYYSRELTLLLPDVPPDARVEVADPQSRLAILSQWIDEWSLRIDGAARDRIKAYRRNQLAEWLQASIKLPDGRWLNASAKRSVPPPSLWLVILPVLTAIGVFGSVMVFLIRRIARPMRDLAAAADAFGRGQAGPAVAERGPLEVRQTVVAFNLMRERLTRFVLDRTRMLASIGHDLRTPITSLRLRAELIEDDETRIRMVETVEELQHMAEAAMAYARAEEVMEDVQRVDLPTLVRGICTDLAEMGRDVTWTDSDPLSICCRPQTLKRAVRNVIENAALHGGSAHVAVTRRNGSAEVLVDDYGPGIEPGAMTHVFEPFVRLDPARGENTGGMGLGLAIAQSIVRGHGGDITLENRRPQGLSVTLAIPA